MFDSRGAPNAVVIVSVADGTAHGQRISGAAVRDLLWPSGDGPLVRVSTDNVGLAKMPDATELIRIGAPLRLLGWDAAILIYAPRRPPFHAPAMNSGARCRQN